MKHTENIPLPKITQRLADMEVESRSNALQHRPGFLGYDRRRMSQAEGQREGHAPVFAPLAYGNNIHGTTFSAIHSRSWLSIGSSHLPAHVSSTCVSMCS